MKTTIFWEDKRDMAGDIMMFINGIVMYIYNSHKTLTMLLGNHAKSTSKGIMNRWKLPKMMRKHHLESINSWSPWFFAPLCAAILTSVAEKVRHF